jgi:hypothetical protein
MKKLITGLALLAGLTIGAVNVSAQEEMSEREVHIMLYGPALKLDSPAGIDVGAFLREYPLDSRKMSLEFNFERSNQVVDKSEGYEFNPNYYLDSFQSKYGFNDYGLYSSKTVIEVEPILDFRKP